MKHVRHGVTAACVLAAFTAFAPSASAGVRFGERTLQMGSRGHDVKVMQSWLSHLGFRTSVDGVFGRGTRATLKRFERKNDLRADGRLTTGEALQMRKLIQTYSAQQNQDTGDQPTVPGGQVEIVDAQTAVAPDDAPQEVKDVVAAANEITDKPYRWGGGHGSFQSSGYDCSGAVSYALHGGGLLRAPLDSSGFFSWGDAGRGSWITVYTSSSHAYLVVGGARFDTSGSGEKGPRWRVPFRSGSGYKARHPAGL